MDSARVDRLARACAKSITRRQLAGLVSTLLSLLNWRVARGSQLGAVICGEQGAICTLLSRCCEGLTCAMSTINPSYGICVPGEGGMISTGTPLISPFGGSAAEDATGLAQTDSTAPATDPQTEREAHIAEIRARKDAKRSKRQTRLDTRRSTQQLRKDQRHSQQLDDPEPESDPVSPQLQLKLMSTTQNEGTTAVDTVKVTNVDDVSILLTRIEPRLTPNDGTLLTDAPARFTLSPGESYRFVAGLPAAEATNEEFDWIDLAACNGSQGAGYRLKAAFSLGAKNHDYVILCDGPRMIRFPKTHGENARPKRHD